MKIHLKMASKTVTAKLETRHSTEHSLSHLTKMSVMPNNSITFPALFSSGKKKVYYQRTRGWLLQASTWISSSTQDSHAVIPQQLQLFRRGEKKLAFMFVVKLVHISSSKVFWSKVIVKMFTQKVYWYFENNSSKQTLRRVIELNSYWKG